MQHAIRVIGEGSIGGKATGFWKARQLIFSEEVLSKYPEFKNVVYFPRTICIATDLYDQFIEKNKLQDLLDQCIENGDEKSYNKFKKAVMKGNFPDEVNQKFRDIWGTMSYPLAVRSSSMLEDQEGTSFAGKYTTVFISNRGSDKERWKQFTDAMKTVYASVGSPNAIEYRRKHGFLSEDEKMAVMVQRAVGREYQGYFFPLLAGVGFSQNGYCWHGEVKKEDALVRLVFGLGTRAVGRGYARLFSPAKPTARPEGHNAASIDKYSQAMMDVLDLKNNSLKSINFKEVIKDGFDCYPGAERICSLRDGKSIYVPATKFWEPDHKPVITFDSMLFRPWVGVDLPKLFSNIMKVLENGFSCPVDIEFAGELDNDKFKMNILQTRPLTQREEHNPKEMPAVKDEDVICRAVRDVPTAEVSDIEYIIYVGTNEYFSCPIKRRQTVARIVGNLNRKLVDKRFILVGPGRWGSNNVELGVPAVYAELCHAKMLIEVASGKYAPEVSFGTHFFQDLIEDNIVYMPLYPDEEGVFFNEAYLKNNSVFNQLLTDSHDQTFNKLISVIHVPASFNGKLAHAVLNGVTEKGLIYLK